MKAILILSLLLNPGVNIYPMTGEIIAVDYSTDIVTIDSHDNLWEFYGTDDWLPGDIAACIMSDNGTQEIYDDEIVIVRYQN